MPVVVSCKTGCPQDAVIAALRDQGMWPESPEKWPTFSLNGHARPLVMADPFADIDEDPWTIPQPSPDGFTNIVYPYYDEGGVLLFQKVRQPGKRFLLQGPDGTNGIDGIRRVLYRLPEVLRASPDQFIFVVEGEKDADALHDLGLIATTNFDGAAGTWTPEYAEALRGRQVVIIPDNDTAGENHATDVMNACTLSASVRILHLPNLPEKGDVSDWLADGGTAESLIAMAVAITPRIDYPLQNLAELLENASIEEPEFVEGLLWTGRVHWFFSAPNSGKTLLLLAMGMHVAAGRPFHGRAVKQGSVLLIEEDTPLSVISEYVAMLADIYDFDLATLPFYITKEPGMRITDLAGTQRFMAVVDRLPEKPALVIYDACERIVPSDKFSTKELDPFTTALQRLTSMQITVAVIDHTRKQGNVAPKKKGEVAAPVDPIDLLYGGRAKSSIADILIYITGKVSNDATLSFVKFRGEAPESMVVGFKPDEGFIFPTGPRTTTKTPTEQAIIRWFQSGHHVGSFTSTQIITGASVPKRTGERALTNLVKRKWIIKNGPDKFSTYYLNSSVPGVLG